MIDNSYLDIVLDSMPDSVYILDDKGNYIFVNSSYSKLLCISKKELMKYNVYDFLKEKTIDICISDIVYTQKRRVALFQDIYLENGTKKLRRQLVISTPIFNDKGEVNNIVAIVRPVDAMNDYILEAYGQSAVSSVVVNNTKKENNKMIAKSPEMRRLIKMAMTIASTDSTVLITGESGTGKEVLAQYMHHAGNRTQKPMIAINCASLPQNLLEAELFGYEKGAFTGALPTGKMGFFEEANGGTLFLDEINSVPLAVQAKLLRAIETKQIQRVGSTKLRDIDFRLIVATNEDLHEMVKSKSFRADLFYRLNVIPLNIPPLRERKEDIIPLAQYFLDYYCKKYSKANMFAQRTLDLIYQYTWPGNVRELKNFVERSVVMSMEGYIAIDNIRNITGDTGRSSGMICGDDSHSGMDIYDYSDLLKKGVSLNDFLKEAGAAYIQYAMDTYGSSYRTALALGTSQSTIIRRKR